MRKVLLSQWFWLGYATCLILFASTLFASWVAMVGVWFSLFFIFRLTKQEAKLSPAERQLYLTAVGIYPLAETLVKWLLMQKIIPADLAWLNRLEHGCWSAATVILFLPVLIDVWRKLSWWQNLTIVISFICLIGNLNEFFEYWLRAKDGIKNYYLFAEFYSDTIYDMVTNIIGGSIGFIILRGSIK